MNNNIATEIIELLCKKFGIAFDWTSQEMWPYIQQLMTELATGKFHFWLIMSIIFTILTIIFIIILIREMCSVGEPGPEQIFLGFPSLIMLIVSICYAVQWKYMPTIMAYKWVLNALSNK